MYKKSQLDNGIRVITHDINNRDSVAIGFWVGVGGRYEKDKIKGAAHFLEHMLFKGSQKYSCEAIKEKIEGVGGTLNAFTSEEQTCYFAKIPAKHFETTFDVLSDMVFFPKLAPKDVAKEKTVIVEEIKMYHDLPQFFVLENLDELLWPDHPLGKNLAGTQETVMGMSAKNLRDFHREHYTCNNIVVAACGKIKHQEILRLVKKRLGALDQSQDHSYESFNKSQKGSQGRFCKKDIEQTHLAFGVHGYNENNKDKYALGLLSTILGGNMSSRLFVEIREKRGLAYSISSSAKALHDTGFFLIRAGVDNNKVNQAVDLILKELRKVKRKEVSLGEFKRGKDYLLGQLLLGMEDTMDHMLWIGEALVARNKTKTLKNIVKEFEAITRKDILRVANEIFNEDSYNLAIVGPIEDKQITDLKGTMKI